MSKALANDFKRQGTPISMVVKDRIGHTRYLVFEVVPGQFDRRDIIRAINKISTTKGINPSPRLILFEHGKGIVRCTNKDLETIRALLPFITEVRSETVAVKTVKVSGSLLKAKTYL
jgi:RNase P/RNase MRP subunit POP5